MSALLHKSPCGTFVANRRRILDRGADPRVRDSDGETPYDSVRHGWEKQRGAAAEIEMNENSRCSTLFHLLVPGGKWLTIDSPIRARTSPRPTADRRDRR